MLLKHIFTPKIAHSSYLLVGKKSCAVVDPRRDIDVYLAQARELGVRITHILETHLHADFVSGHLDLAQATGAPIFAPRAANCGFAHEAIGEGDVIEIEDMRLDVLETPGHTPEHVCYVVTDTGRGDSPVGVFSGDALFVGDVGRPDLFPGRASELAGKLYHSLHNVLLNLPDHCEVYPAHGAGSLCGRSVGAKWRSTIGYERRHNTALQIRDQEAFVRSLTNDMPPAPDHFRRCSEINRQGPRLLADLDASAELSPAEFRARRERDGTVVVDVRGYPAFAGMHVPGSIHLDLAGNFPTFAGWVLAPQADILWVADRHEAADEATLWARRVGLDGRVAHMAGGIAAWATSGFEVEHLHLVSAEDLHDRVTGQEGIVLVDVRTPLEFIDSHIQGAVNIPAPDLRTRHTELNPEKRIFFICSSGNRSGLAASLLRQHGFREVHNVAGGMTGYSAAGHAKQCSVCENPHGSRYFAQIAGQQVEVDDRRER